MSEWLGVDTDGFHITRSHITGAVALYKDGKVVHTGNRPEKFEGLTRYRMPPNVSWSSQNRTNVPVLVTWNAHWFMQFQGGNDQIDDDRLRSAAKAPKGPGETACIF